MVDPPATSSTSGVAGPRFSVFLNRWSVVISILISLNILGIFFSLYCALFGPQWGMAFGIIGFLLGWCAMVSGLVVQDKKQEQTACPCLAERFPWLNFWRLPFMAL